VSNSVCQSDSSLSDDHSAPFTRSQHMLKSLCRYCLQVNHRHAERRALVAEACGALAPYVAPEMRPSLILSILQQMSTDADAIVRRAVVHSLTHLLPLLPDLDKFQAVSIRCFANVDARPRLLDSLHTCLELIGLHLSVPASYSALYACKSLSFPTLQYMEGLSCLVHIRQCQESDRVRHRCNNSPAVVTYVECAHAGAKYAFTAS